MSDHSEHNSMRFRLLHAGAERFAIDEDHVKAVVDWTEPTPLPFAPDALLGVVCIEGQMFTVLDLVKLFQPQRSDSVLQKIITLEGDEQLALAVDAILDKVEPLPEQIRRIETTNPDLVSEVVEHQGADWQVINLNELFNVLIRGRERRRRRF